MREDVKCPHGKGAHPPGECERFERYLIACGCTVSHEGACVELNLQAKDDAVAYTLRRIEAEKVAWSSPPRKTRNARKTGDAEHE